jgi:DNA repair protein RecO (recombination protein O)
MALVHDRCICLRKVEYSETSQILSLFAREHGLQKVVAKGAHRRTKAGSSKFDGGVDMLDVGEAVFSHRLEKDLGLLTEWSLREGHLALRRNLRGMYLGLYAAELVGTLFEEHDPHPAVFDRLEATLGDLAGDPAEEAFLAFELDLLREAGYLPEMSACVNCGAEMSEGQEAYFSPARGGVACRNCEGVLTDRVSLDGSLLGVAKGMMSGAAATRLHLTRRQSDPLNRVIAEHLEHALGKRMRMRDYVL